MKNNEIVKEISKQWQEFKKTLKKTKKRGDKAQKVEVSKEYTVFYKKRYQELKVLFKGTPSIEITKMVSQEWNQRKE
jgi:hypothetical protein